MGWPTLGLAGLGPLETGSAFAACRGGVGWREQGLRGRNLKAGRSSKRWELDLHCSAPVFCRCLKRETASQLGSRRSRPLPP